MDIQLPTIFFCFNNEHKTASHQKQENSHKSYFKNKLFLEFSTETSHDIKNARLVCTTKVM
jgi:hypothetical protein